MKKTYIKPEISKEELRKMLIETNEKLEEANRKLSETNEKLLQQEKERTALFANLSHDLRSSLAVIAGAVELLQEDAQADSETGQTLSLVAKRTGFMQRLIEDMFFLAKLESKEEQIRMREIDLRPFLEEYFFSVQADRRFSGRDLRLDIPEACETAVFMDPEMTVRILDNLFRNAEKYAGENAQITLGVSEWDQTETVEIYVRDNGPGISAEDLPHIFERTYRSSRARTPDDGSSGLGLPIAKNIAERMGGTLCCESTKGQGSTFSFTLKRALSAN